MTRSVIADTERIFQYGIGAVRTVLIHSQNVIHYHIERLNEAGKWEMILERYFTPQQFTEFVLTMEGNIPRVIDGCDRLRDSIHVSVILASDDLSKDQEFTQAEGR